MIFDIIFYMWDAVTELLVAWTPKNSASRPNLVIALVNAPPPPLPRIINDYRRILGVTL